MSKKRLNRTEIVKYLYIYEWYHRLHLGTPGLGVKFVRWHYGPYSSEVLSELDILSSFGNVNCDILLNMFGNPAYYYNTDEIPPELIAEETDIADCVLDLMDGCRYQNMIDEVYSTPPMLQVLEKEELLGRKLEGTELDMDRTNGTFKRTVAGSQAARQRLRRMQPKGTNEEYSRVLQEEYQALNEFRRRASIVTDIPRSR